MLTDPRKLGLDATKTATLAQLTRYETVIVENFIDNAVMLQFVGSNNVNTPGESAYEFKKEKKGGRPSTSRDGDDENEGSVAFDPLSNLYVVTNQTYHIKKYELDRAVKSGFQIDTRSAASVGKRIGEELDYKVWNGHDNPTMTGIKAGAGDAGAPTGVWDTSGNAYADLLKVVGKLRDQGWDGIIDLLFTPGILKILDRFVSDGTTTFSKTFRAWLLGETGIQGLLNGGSIFASSHPFTVTGAPSTTDKKTGTSGAADNELIAHARGQGGEIELAHDLISLPRPAQEGDIYKNVKIKYTVANWNPVMFAYMDAIDTVT